MLLQSIRRIRMVLLFCIVSMGGTVFFSETVFADYYEMPTQLLESYSNHISTNDNNESTGEGLASKVLRIAVYTDQAGSDVNVRISGISCNDLNLGQSGYSSYNNDNSTGNPTGGGYLDLTSGRCSSDSGYVTVPISIGTFAPSDKFGTGIYAALLTIRVADGTTISPKFTVFGGNRLSYMGYPEGEGEPDTDNDFRYGPGLSRDGGRGTITVYFAPPCGYGTQQTKFYWRDADSEKDANGKITPGTDGGPYHPVTYRIFDDTDSDYSMNNAENADDASGVIGRQFTARGGHKYHVTFYNVRGNAGDSIANAIQIWLPFSSAGYYDDCGGGPGWEVSWVNNYILRTAPSNYNFGQGESVGDVTRPELGDSPQPGHSFNYINDARNSGAREITNLHWSKVCTRNSDSGNGKCYDPTGSANDRWWSDSYQVVNPAYTNQEDYENYQDNTQLVYFDTPGGQFSARGTGVAAGKYVGGPGWVWDTFNVTAADGGATRCVNASFWPNQGISNKTPGVGTTSWTIPGSESRVYAPQLCVSVPYYYNLIPSLTISSNGNGLTEIQQGDAVNVTGTVRDTALGDGRQHTNSEAGKVKGVVEFVLAPNTAIPTIGAESMVGQEPCTWIGTKGVAVSASNCGRRGEVDAAVNANGTIAINGGRTAAETENMAVGTKLCYATYINHPRHINNDDYNNGDSRWSYSPVQCKAIIKAPKVQFENGDVTVGRYRSDGQVHTVGGVTAACEPNVATSTIETTGAPSVVTPRANPHLYGSWAEYGAFAPGSISGFGTATRPFGIGMNDTNGAKRLMFSNTDDGQFSYGGQCLQNPFTAIKPDNITNLTTQTPQAFDSEGRLRLNELAEKYDASFDRTGYVSRGQNVDIAQPSSDIPVSQVRVSAKSKFATGNSGCPKLRIVASEGSTTDQDTKGVCSTSFETYTFAFHMNVAGPSNLNMQFVNDAWAAANPSQANRDLVIQSVEVNGVQVYSYSASSPGVSVLRTGTGSCAGSDAEGGLYLHADAVSAATGAYCYGLNVVNINAPVAEDPNHGPYNPLPTKTTITVSANALSSNTYGSGASTANGCPQLYMTVISKSGGTNRADVQSVCQDTSGWADYVFTTNVGSKGIDSIEVGYDPPDAYGSTGTRDLFVRNINVNGLDYPTTRTASIDLRSNPAYKQPTDASIPQCTSPVDRISMYAAQDSADTYHCVGVRISNVVNPPPPPPPASVLDGTYDRFKGRDIVIYAQKNNPGDSCSSSSSGNLRISQNIAYRKDGFANVNELPRIVLMADCNITIADNVTEVNASLIAGDAIKTCTNRAETISECNLSLRVNGSLSANRLLLWRTYGADLVDAGAAQIPAESFNLSPSQMIAGYSRGINSAKATTVYEIDLPPRY